MSKRHERFQNFQIFFASFRGSKSTLCHLLCEATCSLGTDKQLEVNVTLMNIQKLSQSSNEVIESHFHVSNMMFELRKLIQMII